jgi:hypothetical protein
MTSRHLVRLTLAAPLRVSTFAFLEPTVDWRSAIAHLIVFQLSPSTAFARFAISGLRSLESDKVRMSRDTFCRTANASYLLRTAIARRSPANRLFTSCLTMTASPLALRDRTVFNEAHRLGEQLIDNFGGPFQCTLAFTAGISALALLPAIGFGRPLVADAVILLLGAHRRTPGLTMVSAAVGSDDRQACSEMSTLSGSSCPLTLDASLYAPSPSLDFPTTADEAAPRLLRILRDSCAMTTIGFAAAPS